MYVVVAEDSWKARHIAADADRPARARPGPRIGAMSHGTRQKVGIVQAFMHRPAVLVLDEPTAGLDPPLTGAVLLALALPVFARRDIAVPH